MPVLEKRYAEALADVAETSGFEDFTRDLEELSDIYEKVTELRLVLLNPEVKTGIKKNMIDMAFSDKIKPELLSFLKLLVEKGRIQYLPQIRKEFLRIADTRRNILNMKIISAVPLNEQQIDSIKSKYKNKYNAGGVRAETVTDSSMMGGIKVIIGDRVEDATLKARLEDLKKVLLQ